MPAKQPTSTQVSSAEGKLIFNLTRTAGDETASTEVRRFAIATLRTYVEDLSDGLIE